MQTSGDGLLLRSDPTSPFGLGYTLFVIVHSSDWMLPLPGIAKEFAGQTYMTLTPKPYVINLFRVEVTHYVRLNTRSHKCVEDPDYSLLQCFEDYVAEKAKCASPWDVYPKEVVNLFYS